MHAKRALPTASICVAWSGSGEEGPRRKSDGAKPDGRAESAPFGTAQLDAYDECAAAVDHKFRVSILPAHPGWHLCCCSRKQPKRLRSLHFLCCS